MKTIKTTALAIAALCILSFIMLAFKNAGHKKVIMEVTHEVKDYASWKAGFDADKGRREKGGIKVLGLYTSADNNNIVTLITEVPSIEVAKGFMSDPQLKANMEKAGVISKPEVKIMFQQQ